VPPASLAEFTLGGDGDMDFFDVSYVDGFNVPMSITPGDGFNRAVDKCAPIPSCSLYDVDVPEGMRVRDKPVFFVFIGRCRCFPHLLVHVTCGPWRGPPLADQQSGGHQRGNWYRLFFLAFLCFFYLENVFILFFGEVSAFYYRIMPFFDVIIFGSDF
jgi:hypothetical protein